MGKLDQPIVICFDMDIDREIIFKRITVDYVDEKNKKSKVATLLLTPEQAKAALSTGTLNLSIKTRRAKANIFE